MKSMAVVGIYHGSGHGLMLVTMFYHVPCNDLIDLKVKHFVRAVGGWEGGDKPITWEPRWSDVKQTSLSSCTLKDCEEHFSVLYFRWKGALRITASQVTYVEQASPSEKHRVLRHDIFSNCNVHKVIVL